MIGSWWIEEWFLINNKETKKLQFVGNNKFSTGILDKLTNAKVNLKLSMTKVLRCLHFESDQRTFLKILELTQLLDIHCESIANFSRPK